MKPNPQHLRQLAEAAKTARVVEMVGADEAMLDYVCAMDPHTTIALLDELTALRAARDEVCELAERLSWMLSDNSEAMEIINRARKPQ